MSTMYQYSIPKHSTHESTLIASRPQLEVKRPIARHPYRSPPSKPTDSQSLVHSSRDELTSKRDSECGICFEPATPPLLTPCCARLFCTAHIAGWVHGPAADGQCPGCGTHATSTDLTALLALAMGLPRAPPPSRAASPVPALSLSTTFPESGSASAPGSYAAYPASPCSDSSTADEHSQDEDESEDATDYSLPALLRARALQTRRHVPHPFTSVLGARAALTRVLRVAVCVGVVGVVGEGAVVERLLLTAASFPFGPFG
ncbi:hypothetical protein B0H14DRAFT_173083 [Mycena olivaceomarginata]|nr:hypothetical protein B0H14DRAFT_173083 [Mycena olivaceomarginata]